MESTFKPMEKVIINRGFEPENGRIIGIKQELNGQYTYMVELVRKDFSPHVFGSKIIRVSPGDIQLKTVKMERHSVSV